ncbi:MAG: DNA translocase FtsK 4TM domain-containing protein [Patescibacteria group bacterium]
MRYRRRKTIFSRRPGRPSTWRLGSIGRGGFFNFNLNLTPETKEGIFIIFLFVLAALSLLGLFDLSGSFGGWIAKILAWIFGSVKWLFPILALLFVYFLLRKDKYRVRFINYFGAVLLFLGLTVLWHLRFEGKEAMMVAKNGLGGGYLGAYLSTWLFGFMGFWGTFVVALAFVLVGLLLVFEISIYGLFWPVKFFKFLFVGLKKFFGLVKSKSELYRTKKGDNDSYEEEEASGQEADLEEEETPISSDTPEFKKSAIGLADEDGGIAAIAKPRKFGKKIELPLSLFIAKSSKPTVGDIKANQEIIRKTLANFGIPVEMAEVNIGPTVAQYTFRPADGMKLSKIINLNSDLALALAAHPIRIEAPIPGRSLVGVEVPNQLAARVTMGEMLASKEFKNRRSNLEIALGKDVSGQPYFVDLARMPHLLIAGATGSGKSVCINSLIVSLIYQNNPDDLKFILVDPKRVELPVYNSIPYLLTPVITDIKKTVNALKWTIVEMERRFEVLSRSGKKNIDAYNQSAVERLPYIIFAIDELADLMASSASDVEAGIVRLAQMSRAVGIHLVLATQRPSVEVITGLIKANIPARIAFSVASLIDSRTILDSSGAEKLVGRGDMLYLGPDISKPKRLQGVFLSDREIKNVVDYIKSQGEASYVDEIGDRQVAANLYGGGGGGFESGDDDSLLEEAKEVIRQSGKASASLLQRRLKVGYARAARMLDLLEERGIIGPADGAKPREVYLDRLGGVGAMEFAAHEYDLAGELKPENGLENEEEEPSFTAFSREEEKEMEPAEEEVVEEVIEEEIVDDEPEEEVEEVEEVVEEEIVEEIEPEAEEEEEEEEEKTEQKNKKSKNFFSEDEWT